MPSTELLGHYINMLENFLGTGEVRLFPSMPEANAKKIQEAITVENKAQAVLEVLQDFLSLFPPFKRIAHVEEIAQLIKSAKQSTNEEVIARVKLFKNYKQLLLKPYNFTPVLEKSFVEQHVNFSSEIPLNINDRSRFKFFTSVTESIPTAAAAADSPVSVNFAAAVGTSYFSAREKEEKKSHVLDAMYVADLGQEGYVLAVGDGCGGHTGDEKDDRSISRASKFACKYATRLFATYDDPNELERDLPALVQKIAEEVRRKTSANTTFAAARVFIVNDKIIGPQYRIVGVNIGDTAFAGYNPMLNRFITLAPGRAVEGGAFSGTANFPGSYTTQDMQYFSQILPGGVFLIPMSDGGYDHHTTIKHPAIFIETEADSGYVDCFFDPAPMKSLFAPIAKGSSADVYLSKFMAKAIECAEHKRIQMREKAAPAQEKYDRLLQEDDAVTKKIQALGEALEASDMAGEALQKLKTEYATLRTEQKKLRAALGEAKFDIDYRHGDDIMVGFLKLPELPEPEIKNVRRILV